MPEKPTPDIQKQLKERRARLQQAGQPIPDQRPSNKPDYVQPPEIEKPAHKLLIQEKKAEKKTTPPPSQHNPDGKPSNTRMSRRDFLKLSGIATLGASTGAVSYELERSGISGFFRNWVRRFFEGDGTNQPPTAITTPTETPRPTQHLTDEPTQTPTPKKTSEPDPTKTKEPTNTPESTNTSEPTNTQKPTETPEPTNTQQPTKEVDRANDPVYEFRNAFGDPVNFERHGVSRPTLREIQGVSDPLDRPIYYGFTPNNRDWNPDQPSIDETARLGDKTGALIQFYLDWSENPWGSQLNTEWMNRIRNQGAIPTITWMPGDARFWGQKDHPDFKKYSLKNIAEGRFDNTIRAWAISARDWGQPFFLRFGHEMNGHDKWWPYPWLTGVNPDTGKRINTPQDFTAAWRHVHDIFQEVGATNATWVWCPDSAGDISEQNLRALYPGDRYVNWVATDIYEWGSEKPHDDFFANFKKIYNLLLKIAPQKPIMLSEFGSQQDGREKADWMPELFLKHLPWLFPQVQAVIYFDKNKPDEGRNWRINTSSGSQRSYAQAISSQYYTDGQFGNIRQSPIPVASQLV